MRQGLDEICKANLTQLKSLQWTEAWNSKNHAGSAMLPLHFFCTHKLLDLAALALHSEDVDGSLDLHHGSGPEHSEPQSVGLHVLAIYKDIRLGVELCLCQPKISVGHFQHI